DLPGWGAEQRQGAEFGFDKDSPRAGGSDGTKLLQPNCPDWGIADSVEREGAWSAKEERAGRPPGNLRLPFSWSSSDAYCPSISAGAMPRPGQEVAANVRARATAARRARG